ncbi:MAG: hypothetical protein QXG00_02005 [Candidatus Woesearchaeota archaeon]
MGLFFKKSKVYSIQINDDKINKEICILISKLKKNITDFMNILQGKFLGDKDEKLEEIMSIFGKMVEDIKKLIDDVLGIQNIELQKRDFIKINDEQFLKDKLFQLNKIKEILDTLIDMLEQKPTDKEFKEDLLRTMIQNVNEIIGAINKILEDDKGLDAIYRGIENV